MITIECPSGFVFEAREFKTGDIGHISRGQPEQLITGLLQACHERTITPGPNPAIRADGKPPWRKVCWGDLLYATIEIRRSTFREPLSTFGMVDRNNPDDDRPIGDLFYFDTNCVFCKKNIPMSVDLVEYLDRCTHRIDEPTMAEWADHGHLLYTMMDGTVVKWRPSTPDSDQVCRDFMKRQKLTEETIVETIARHLVEVDGLVDSKGKPKRDFQALWKWVQDMKPIESTLLMTEINERQPGFDNELVVTCNECQSEQRILIPLRHPAFLSPSLSRQAKEALIEKSRAKNSA